MKIFIFWAWGSWKSFLAKKLAQLFNIVCFELDEVLKGIYQEEDRSIIISDIISKNKNYIIEWHYQQEWVDNIISDCELIILVKTPSYIRKYRLIKRTIIRMLWIEKTYFKSNIKTIVDLRKFDNKYTNEQRENNFIKRLYRLKSEHKLYIINNTIDKNITILIKYLRTHISHTSFINQVNR